MRLRRVNSLDRTPRKDQQRRRILTLQSLPRATRASEDDIGRVEAGLAQRKAARAARRRQARQQQRLVQQQRANQQASRQQLAMSNGPRRMRPQAYASASPRQIPTQEPMELEPLELEPSDAGDELGRIAERQPIHLPRLKQKAPEPFGPPVRLGNHLRLQTGEGYRAGVIELRPGLFLVAELPTEALKPEFGMAPLLAPMVISAASKALENPEHQQALIRTSRKGLGALSRQLQKLKERQSGPRTVLFARRHEAKRLSRNENHHGSSHDSWLSEALEEEPQELEEQDSYDDFGCEGEPCRTCRWRGHL